MRKPDFEAYLLELNCLSHRRIVFLGRGVNDDEESGVDTEMVRKASLALLELDAAEEKPIGILIHSFGGDVLAGYSLFDLISGCRSHVTTVVCGAACSAASFFMQAADERVITPNSWLMLHDGFYSMSDMKKKDAMETIRVYKEWSDQFARVYMEKMGLSLSRVKKILENDKWIGAKEAIEMKLVDRIAPTWKDALPTAYTG